MGRDSDSAGAALALNDTCALWEAVCRVTHDFILLLDRDCRIGFLNRAGDGHTPEGVVGRSLTELVLPDSVTALAEMVEEVFKTGTNGSLEVTVRTPRGSLNYYQMHLGPVCIGGQTVAVLACSESILPLKETERSLERERNLLRRLIEIQERERQLVSYEIHDGLAQYLTGAIMHFQAWEVALGDHPGMDDLQKGVRLLQAAAEESRRLISGLRPPDLDELGIIEAIESLVADAQTEVPRVTFVHDLPGPRLPPMLETTIFRIVQESLSNVRKHAAATAARVELVRDGEWVRIRVQDDGCGFDPAAVADDRFGLESIRQRSRLFGGEPEILSAPGAGTTIAVSLPIPPHSEG